jgi:DNA-directed RNA polymerase specialized sigma24 family protein
MGHSTEVAELGGIDVNLSLLLPEARDDPRAEAEWVRVFNHFDPRLREYFGGNGRNVHDLDGLMSDIWQRAIFSAHTLRSQRAMWSWLTKIGRNADIDTRRKHRREVPWSDVTNDPRLLECVSEWEALGEQDECSDDWYLNELGMEDIEFLESFAIDGLSHDALARRFGLASAASSRQRLRRIRKSWRRFHEEKERGRSQNGIVETRSL